MFDWRQFNPMKQYMSMLNNKDFDPVKQYMHMFDNHNIASDLEKHIKETMKQYLPNLPHADADQWTSPFAQPDGNTHPMRANYQLFEIHGYIIIRMQIPQTVNLDEVIIKCGRFSVIIEWPGQTVTVPLPAAAQRKNIEALLQERLLEIRLPRVKEEEYTVVHMKHVT